MAVRFKPLEETAEAPRIRFRPLETGSGEGGGSVVRNVRFRPLETGERQQTLGDYLATPDLEVSVSSPVTSGVRPEVSGGLGEPIPATEEAVVRAQVPEGDVPARIGETEIQPMGEPGTYLHGVTQAVAGILNRPELIAAMAHPATLAAVALRYTPEVVKQGVEDLGKAAEGDNEALGRATVALFPFVLGGAKGAVKLARSAEGEAALSELANRQAAAETRTPLRAPGEVDLPAPVPELATGTDPGTVFKGTERSVRQLNKPVVPETPAEPMRDVSVVQEIRDAGAKTKREIKQLYPGISNEKAGELRRAAWEERPAEPVNNPQLGVKNDEVLPGAAETFKEVVKETEGETNASEVGKAKEVGGDVLRVGEETRAAEERVPVDEDSPRVRKEGKELVPDVTPEDLQAEARADLVKEKEILGMGGAVPSEFEPVGKSATSIKNAVVDRERAARGLPPAVQPLRQKFGQAWEKAMSIIDRDPATQDRLLVELRENPRAINDVEDALVAHRQVDLQNEYGKATRDLAQAFDDGRMEAVQAEKARVADLSDQLLDIYEIGKKAGTETGRGLAARRMTVNQDFTLGAMVTERRAAQGGKRLSEKQQAETEESFKEITEAKEKLEKVLVKSGEGKAPEEAPATGKTKKPGARTKKTPKKPAPEVVDAEFQLDKAKKKWAGKLDRTAQDALPTTNQILGKLLKTGRLIRTFRTGLDLSAVLRQGKLAWLTRPSIPAKAVWPMLKSAVSEKEAFAIDREIRSRENFPRYERAKLELTEHGKSLAKMEEPHQSELAESIPVFAGSQRAYSTFLNRVRADLFDVFAATLDAREAPTLAKDRVLANYINVITGRGDLGKFNAAAEPMSFIFFAPRFVASRFQTLLGQPLYYGTLSGKVKWREGAQARKLVAGEYARLLLGISAFYGATTMFTGATIETDPRSSDFGKLKLGKTRIDPMAGLIQSTVFLSRMASGKTKNLRGKVVPISGKVPYGSRNVWNVITDFGRMKLAPVPAAIVNARVGTDPVGNEVTPGSTLLNLTVPISYQDILDVMEENGVEAGTALQILSVFGEGVSVYDDRKKR